MIKLLPIIIALLPFLSFSNERNINLKVGRGIANSKDGSYYAVSSQQKFLYVFTDQFELGAYTNSFSGLAAYSLGIHLNKEVFYIEGLSGIGVITRTDSLLGGYFQFFHDVGMGLENSGGFCAGVGYKHISSAGISTPNLGRDYLYLKLGIPLEW